MARGGVARGVARGVTKGGVARDVARGVTKGGVARDVARGGVARGNVAREGGALTVIDGLLLECVTAGSAH